MTAPVSTSPVSTQAPPADVTMADIAAEAPAARLVPGRSGDYLVEVLPLGADDYTQISFYEPGGPLIKSCLWSPQRMAQASREGLALSDLAPATVAGVEGQQVSRKDLLDTLQKVGQQEPAEADPAQKDREAVQLPAEGELFNRLASKQIVEATLAKVFDTGSIGRLIHVGHLDAAKTKPLFREIYFQQGGQVIPVATIDFSYDENLRLERLVTVTLESFESRVFRKVVVEETLKSTSVTAGLTLSVSPPTQASFDGILGQEVNNRGRGTGVGFDLSMVKTFSRLRIEAELELFAKLGAAKTTVTLVPRTAA